MTYPIDTHMHTVHCGHADPAMTVAALVAAAAERGLEAICITEHIHEPAHLARVDCIREELAALRPGLDVYVGAEVDAAAMAADGSLVAPTEGLAYVIASCHQFPGTDTWWYTPLELDADERAALLDRWFAWAKAIVANPAVDTFAHPGASFSRSKLSERFDEALRERFREVFAAAAEHGTAIELNELLARKLSPAHLADYPTLIRIAAEEGCRFVIGSDAHAPAAVGEFHWVLEIADAAGLGAEQLTRPDWRAAPAAT